MFYDYNPANIVGICFQFNDHETLTQHLKVIVRVRINSRYIENSFKYAIGTNVYLLNIETISKYANDNSNVTSKIRFASFHGFCIPLILNHDMVVSAYKHMLSYCTTFFNNRER